jgi:hypothetical protein
MTYFPKLSNLPPLTAWSYSRYNTYTTCPMKFAYTVLLKMQDPKPKGPALLRGIDIHKEGELYLIAPKKPRKVPASYQHFAEEMEQLRTMSPAVEQQWGFTQSWEPTGWFSGNTWVRNVLDVSVQYPDDTALVIDFKTGKKYGSNEDQMKLFALVTFKKFPNLKEVSTRLWYLDIADANENEVEHTYKVAEAPAIQRDWEKKVKPMFNDRKFPPRPGRYCQWCFLSKAEGGPCKY